MIGPCRIERALETGYLARHTKLDVAALVRLLPAGSDLRDAARAERLRHPNIVSVLESGTDPASGLPFIVHEHVEGGTAVDLIRGGPVTLRRALEIAVGVSRALAAVADRR
jgi:serine/threonine protein kinase